MAKDNAKLISMRLEADLFDAIKELEQKHTYWNRSAIINNLLAAVLYNFDSGAIYDMLRTYNWDRHEVEATFKINNDSLLPKSKRHG